MKNLYFIYGDDLESIFHRLGEITSSESISKKDCKSYEITTTDDIELFFERESNLTLFDTSDFLKINLDIKGFKLLDKEKDRFLNLLNVLSVTNVILVLSLERFDKNTKTNIEKSELYKDLKKQAIIESFPLLKYWQQDEIKEKIRNTASKLGLQIESNALELIFNSFKDNVSNVRQELDKLSLYIQPEKKITKKIAEEFYSSSINVEDIYESLLFGRTHSFSDLESSPSNVGAPLYLIAILQARLHDALKIKLYLDSKMSFDAISKKIGMHPYKVRLEVSKLKKVSVEYLKNLIMYLSELEFNLKNGKISDDNVIDLLLMLPLRLNQNMYSHSL